MEYIKQLQEDLERAITNKLAYVKENNWERAAACRDMELYLQSRLEEAKKRGDQKKATETPLTWDEAFNGKLIS